LSRFRRVSQYDPSFSSSSSSHNEENGGEGSQGKERGTGSLITIPTLERMRELERNEVDVDWEKVKTLPRVCLIPPEGMSCPELAIASVSSPFPVISTPIAII
jgi:hypothetical protein